MDLTARARRGDFVRAVGLMSGTSLDGVDVSSIETDGVAIRRFGPSLTLPYDTGQRDAIRAALGATERSAATELAERVVTDAHVDAVRRYLAESRRMADDVDVVGFHGQTITHRPERRFTWQVGDGALLASRLGLPVVSDFRSADVAAGGQGAPLVPVFHQALVAAAGRSVAPVAVLNIGGVANVTWIGSSGELVAFDTGPGNALINDWVLKRKGLAADFDGALAFAGEVDMDQLRRLCSSYYFSKKYPKSLDRNDFSVNFLDDISVEDGAATLSMLTAVAVGKAVDLLPERPKEWIVCGGGGNNPFLIKKLNEVLGIDTRGASDLGWDNDGLEAQAFGYLAVRSLRELPFSFPTTTGAPVPMSGGRLDLP